MSCLANTVNIMLFLVIIVACLLTPADSWNLPSWSSKKVVRIHSPRRIQNCRLSSISSSRPAPFNHKNNHHRECLMSLSEASFDKQQAFESTPLPPHQQLVQGKLANGFTYLILPNKVPPGRFEAHLEVLSGSVNEMDSQQGMAHLLEHVAYMGSPKRQLIAGTGSRTNAYTDFHHTVFFAACPTQTPEGFWKKPMLPMALDALLDVMITEIDEERLEKERAAVLSEASMVNKMEYRVECQILSTLHRENRLSQRFPIGKEALIKSWQQTDLQYYHSLHYRPDNVILYIVGDVEVDSTIALIDQKFGSLQPKVDAEKVFQESREFPVVSMRRVNRHFPPVTHCWSCTEEKLQRLKVPEELIRPEHQLAPATYPSFTAPKPAAVVSLSTDNNSENHSENNNSDTVQGSNVEAVTNALETSAITSTNNSNSNSDSSDGEYQQTPQVTNTPETPTTTPVLSFPTNTRIFQHELLQSFSFHLFAKRPIEATTTTTALRREVMKRMILSALLIRLNVLQRSDPLFTLADFNQMNWVREGCSVCSLDLTTDVHQWAAAVTVAVQEIRRMGLYGITQSELVRYKQSILSEAYQMAAQSNQLSHEELLNELMECESCGHTYMHPVERYQLIEQLLAAMTVEEVNLMATELCEHLSHINSEAGVYPAAVIACAPTIDRQGQTFTISEAEVNAVIAQALAMPLEPLPETKVPETLLTPTYLSEREKFYQPRFVPLEGIKSSLRENPANKASSTALGVVQRRLANGLRVNLKSLASEPQELHLRLYVPGGRLLEDPQQPGSVLVGARTMQEGGAFSQMSREAVELFCIDHSVGVEITARQDSLVLDFHGTTMVGSGKSLSGAEAIFQVAHIILTDFVWEADAFARAKQSYHEEFDSIIKGLETACQESLRYSLTQGDGRYLSPNHKQLDALTLETVKAAMLQQLTPTNVEVTVSGDVSMSQLEAWVLQYFGTVPPKRATAAASTLPAAMTPLEVLELPQEGLVVKALGKKHQLGVYLPDSEERAMGYLAGPAPNKWGVWSDGQTLADKFVQKTNGKEEERRRHPAFGSVALAIVQEVANRRLFSVVREEKQLTYDAAFQFESLEAIPGGYYTVSVTSSPQNVHAAIRACKVALQSLKGSFGVMGDSVQSAKRSLLSKFKAESLTNKFWMEALAGSQVEQLPYKTLKGLAEYETVVNSVTVQDIQLLIDLLELEEDKMTVCVGVAAPEPPKEMAGNVKVTAATNRDNSTTTSSAPPPQHPGVGAGRMSTATQLS